MSQLANTDRDDPDEDVDTHVDNRDESTSEHKARQLAGLCCRRYCDKPPVDGADYCRRHLRDHRRYRREWMQRQRDEWERKKRCMRCGRPRRKDGSRWCVKCLIGAGKLHRLDVDNHVDNQRERIADSTTTRIESDGVTRTRYHGTAKRGAPSRDKADEFERRILADEWRRYLEGMLYLASDAGKALDRADYEAAWTESLDRLAAGVRAGIAILKHNRYEQRKSKKAR